MEAKLTTSQDYRSRVTENNMCGAVGDIIAFIGDDVSREGIQETPARVVKSWREIYSGYGENPADHLAKKFPIKDSQLVALNGIEFWSTCEHHMLPFFGTVDIAYLAEDFACGLSKLARLVNGFARRLQMQENLTTQIGEAIQRTLTPAGVAVRVRGTHMCMKSRGVNAGGSPVMMTQYLSGSFRDDTKSVKAEWMNSLPE